MTVRIGITGAAGRMGRMLAEAIADSDTPATLAAAIERPESSLPGADMGELLGGDASGVSISSDLAAVADQIDVLIDFTVPESTLAQAAICADRGLPMVVGTTGFSTEQTQDLDKATAGIPFCQASNFAPGVNLTFRLAEAAAKALGNSADIEIVEAHHRHKVDAPSGTAVRMGEIVAETLDRDLREHAIYGREGQTGPRARSAIGFETIRGGDIVGEHTVMFAIDGERLEITHRSHTRANFAYGAMRAARWVVGQDTGLFSMNDVLGLA